MKVHLCSCKAQGKEKEGRKGGSVKGSYKGTIIRTKRILKARNCRKG
jgi:hypothetical protein